MNSYKSPCCMCNSEILFMAHNTVHLRRNTLIFHLLGVSILFTPNHSIVIFIVVFRETMFIFSSKITV